MDALTSGSISGALDSTHPLYESAAQSIRDAKDHAHSLLDQPFLDHLYMHVLH